MKYIESISDILAKAVHGMFMEWKIHQQIVKIDGKYIYIYQNKHEFSFQYGEKVHKSSVREKIKHCEKD